MAQKILVVDDDDITGELSSSLLQGAGLETELATDGRHVLERLRQTKIPLVVLDILMPGVDGLTLCRQIKSDPQFQDVKVVIVSAKTFGADRRRAYENGADLYIAKPYNVATFASRIIEVLKSAPNTKAQAVFSQAEITSNMDPVFEICIWGCRSQAKPGPPSPPSRYGRRTPCVGVEAANRFILFDAGSGILPAGREIAALGDQQELWIFLSHFHTAHIEGLACFPPAAKPEYVLHIGGAREPEKSLEVLVEEALTGADGSQNVQATVDLYQMLEESYNIFPDVTLNSFYANHPGTTLGFVLKSKGRKFVYCPDDELYGENASAMQDHDERLGRLCAGADLLIHDGRYAPQDHENLKDSGHSSLMDVVDFAGKNDIKRLLLFHHDDRYTDADLERLETQARERAAKAGSGLQVALAREGLRLGI